MRVLQALLIITAVIVYVDQSFAGPAGTAAKSADSASIRSFESVFGGAKDSISSLLKSRYNEAPPEVQNAVAANFRTYKDDNFFKLAADGKSAALVAPNSTTDLTHSTVSAIHTEPGTNFTMEFNVANKYNPKSVEIGHEHELPMEGVKDGHFGYPLGYKGMDMVPSVPVKQTYDLPKHRVTEANVYTVLKVGNEDRRFTSHSRLSVKKKVLEGEDRGAWVTYTDGTREFEPSANDINLSARMYRENPNAPIETAALLLKLRYQLGTTIKYELPKRADGKPRQIQDIKFTDNAATDEQTMHVITTDGERLNYVIEKENDNAKLVFKGTEAANMNEYIARKRPIQSRIVIEADGTGGKGLEVEAGK